MIPYLAFFGFAETSTLATNAKKVTAPNIKMANLKLRAEKNLDVCITFDPPPSSGCDWRALLCTGVAIPRRKQRGRCRRSAVMPVQESASELVAVSTAESASVRSARRNHRSRE